MIETNNVVERLRDYIYDCTKDEFGHGWTLSAEQTRHAITLANQSLSDRIDELEGENAALRAKRKLKVVPAPPVVFEDETASLTQGGKNG